MFAAEYELFPSWHLVLFVEILYGDLPIFGENILLSAKFPAQCVQPRADSIRSVEFALIRIVAAGLGAL
jgi:hypothetical protein